VNQRIGIELGFDAKSSLTMKRLLALVLLVGLTASSAIPLHGQPMSVAEYQRQSAKDARKQQKLIKKNAKLQRKAQKRTAKAQQKSLKAAQKADAKANRQLRQK
jgi:hypothetical protein